MGDNFGDTKKGGRVHIGLSWGNRALFVTGTRGILRSVSFWALESVVVR